MAGLSGLPRREFCRNGLAGEGGDDEDQFITDLNDTHYRKCTV